MGIPYSFVVEVAKAAIEQGSATAYLAAAREIASGERSLEGLAPVRVWIARSSTIEPLIPYLYVEGVAAGLRPELRVGAFGTFRAELSDPESALYAAHPDVIVLAIEGAELAPLLYRGFLSRSAAETREAIANAIDDLRGLATTIRSRTGAAIVLQTVLKPAVPAGGSADRRLELGQHDACDALNGGIFRLADEIPGVEVFDLAEHVATTGRAGWEDPRFARAAGVTVAAENLPGLARAYARVLALLLLPRRKCLVVDLDGTLWGGIVGEAGVDGIEIGTDHRDAPFTEFQSALADLHARGVVLAIASKNEESDVDAVFAQRHEMVLTRDHFAARRIDWRDKATMIREIAAELGFGLEAMVFIDDTPAERELVRQLLPAVEVPEWPRAAEDYVGALARITSLDTLRVTAADLERGRTYVVEAARTRVRATSSSLDEYLRSLDMHARIRRLTAGTRARFAQLTQRSTQFNVTLRRYTEAELAELERSTDDLFFTLDLWDKFGGSGHVAVAHLQRVDDTAQVEAFVMSCRVLGRGVETAFLAALAGAAMASGASYLDGHYVPGQRNQQVAQLYARHGFTFVPGTEPARWRLDLAARLAPPDAVTVIDETAEVPA